MKEIINYPNYLIYEDGRVYNKKFKRFLKPRLNRGGYLRIGIRKKDTKQKHFTIHKLIALHYIPNIDNKPCIDHINRIKTDNRIENLRWATHSENAINRNKTIKGTLIRKSRFGTFKIIFRRNTLYYIKTTKTFEEAIIQRDLMLSMFIHDHV